MNRLFNRKRLTLITNLALALIAGAVAAVCFVPERAVKTAAPYYCGNEDGNRVSLVFSVYEGEREVQKILDVFEERNLAATFFVGGCFADDNARLLQRMVEDGHEVGNHGYFNLNHAKISKQKNAEEMQNASKVISALCECKPTLFAPPGGAFGKDTLSAASGLGLKVVMWSRDAHSNGERAGQIYSCATDGIKGGDIILLRPTSATVEALPLILDFLSANGLEQTTVSANLFGG